MEATTEPALQPGPLSVTSSWERWVDQVFVWMPYATLAASSILAQMGGHLTSDRLQSLAFTVVAALWTWVMFTRVDRPTRVPQRALRLYLLGFIVITGLMVLHQVVFLIYGVTGFFHSALLRPWPLMFFGIGATATVVHSHIVIHEVTAENWAIYLGVVAIQTVTTGAGLYAGERITEIADQRRLALERLQIAMDENAGLHAQLVVQAREAGILDERERLAREIHDTIAQGLTGVVTQIEAVHQSWDDETEMRRHLDNAASLARESLTEARRSVQAIRPRALEASRLPGALDDVASRWSKVTGVAVQVQTTGDRRPLRPEVEVTLLRAAQEGLANIARHADASRAGVTLSFMDRSVALDIRDDGVGFDPSAETPGHSFGLAAMRQRVAEVDGVMHVESAPGEGTAISVRIPALALGTARG